MAISILTIIVPSLFYFMLRNLGRIDSIFVENIKQRRTPLFFQVILTGIVLFIVVKGYEFPELYYFFLGILVSAIIAFLASLLRYKLSLHMVGIAGVLFFIIALSMHYGSNLLMAIGVLFFITGAIASSRLEQKAHSSSELFMGMVIGALPQLGLLFFL
ncbi:hypothetical protein [Flavimarina sp. Hel_I_48]|uniref:hypothetical protein n=1 Tax=Flavimarina sp. Hel_I_48 TaxID=1392488 RepID=UPI001F146444|nr:hypothetical protein [Flavimarina sp. Hel_I_48]